MLEIERNFLGMKRKDIWFSDRPFDVEGYQGVMFYSARDKVELPGFARQDFSTIVIDLAQSPEALLKGVDKWERKKINKARNNGVKVLVDEHHAEFFALYRAFRREKGLVPWSPDPAFMRRYGTLLVAELDGEIVAGHFFLHDRDHVRGLTTGSKRLEAGGHRANLIGYANRLLIWEAICHFKEQGLAEYDMGGYYAGQARDEQLERINEVKAGFGGQVTLRYHYEKDYSKLFSAARRTYSAGLSGLTRGRQSVSAPLQRLLRGVKP